MKSNVYFMDFRATAKENLYMKLERLLNTAGMADVIAERDLTAVKLHFGEMGNAAFIRPVYLRRIIELIRRCGGKPFLTDANTLYAGTRSDAPEHLTTAVRNGFSYAVVDAPLVIADGLRGKTETAVPVNLKHFETVYIGKELMEADAMISAAHFKGHELSGFGGALKNVGMGGASRRGKLAQHSGLCPKVKAKKCVGCGDCLSHCSQEAISLKKEKAIIDGKKCIGCGECILICPNGAIEIQWASDIPVFLEKMAEYTKGALEGKAGKAFYINFITDVSPACDCYPANDSAIVRDIGVLASTDLIAIDQASVDLVNQEQALPGCSLTTNTEKGADKFKGLYPKVDWEIQLEYGQAIGLGSREYALKKI